MRLYDYNEKKSYYRGDSIIESFIGNLQVSTPYRFGLKWIEEVYFERRVTELICKSFGLHFSSVMDIHRIYSHIRYKISCKKNETNFFNCDLNKIFIARFTFEMLRS